jgi:predicted ester cyclase
MATPNGQPEQLKMMQGRWFEAGGADGPTDAKVQDNGPNGNRRIASGISTGTSLQTHHDGSNALRDRLEGPSQLPQEDSRQLLNKFLAIVQGQFETGRTDLSTIDENLKRRNIEVMYRYIEYENSRDYENMEKLFHPTEFRSKTYFGNDPISPKAHTRMLVGLFKAFPDWFMVINEIIAADERAVVALITGRGTQHKTFFGRPPADHQIAIPTLHSIKVVDGLIIEHRHINPFEDIFANQIMAPLTEDIMAVRAQQGFDSGMAERAFQAALDAGASEDKLGELKTLIDNKRRQCQVLLKGTLRRCAMIAPPGEIYCEHHKKHGYGIDDED